MDIENCKNYKTEANLLAALEKLGFAQDRYLVVCNRAGRFTAVFPQSNITDGNICRYSWQGFMTLG